MIFVLLFAEGVTILRVDNLISAHVFIGVLLIPFVTVKIVSTTYRFARYYTGQREYVEKGPPPPVLRVLGPFVTVTTIAVFATGIAAVLGRGSHGIALAHKASFIVWFAAMTLHVLGHALQTPRLATDDLRPRTRGMAAGANARTTLLVLTIAVAVPLAIAALQWAHHWQRLRGR